MFPVVFSNQLNLMLNLKLKQNGHQIANIKNFGELIKLKFFELYKT